MPLTGEQDGALCQISDWLKGSEFMFTLHGYAGTGKTYLMQHLINSFSGLDLSCCAPTGKAASVLKSKLSGIDVTTIHKLLYSPNSPVSQEYAAMKLKLKGEPENEDLAAKVEELRQALTKSKLGFEFTGGSDIIPGQLIVVDESSMVTRQMLKDFEATGARLLFVGDGGQLPPVGDDGWFINSKPNAVLQEVQRQALESPIIRLSMDIREGDVDRSQYTSRDCRIVSKMALEHEDWINADQVITGMNKTRHKLNKWFRRKLDYGNDLPMKGEKLICLKNAQRGKGPYINGVQFKAIEDAYIDDYGDHLISIDYEGERRTDVSFYDYHCRLPYDASVKEEPYFTRRDLLELDYGYAITCHKSQGSEWDDLIIADDKMMRQKKDFRKRWLYTAVTRAKEQLTWIQD